jgi:hypothetical protein
MELLKRISNILNEIQQCSSRSPWREIQESRDLKVQTIKKICSQCKANPARLFQAIEKRGMKSIESLPTSLSHYLSALDGLPKSDPCLKCIEITRMDFQYIMKKLEELKAHVLYNAFRIVEVE